ncbi:WG repeat-containing protein [Afifella marina]|uniref:WG containing repeat-containing protein n=1 Tax=Afifella marina DSM 2698 TaxID=1120955 RepID=A0A1G5MYK4_AFIMA|nr:WG repeat-containing protein [Afifella marina]SCZ30265.1 WG containing repeat-containing protein [Afifella marina DSM 2698]
MSKTASLATLGAALLASALAAPTAQAQMQTCSVMGGSFLFSALYPATGEMPSRSNDCMSALGDGMAAVQLPIADKNIDDIAAAQRRGYGLSDHKWGFLDRDGKLAISPKFDAVQPFAQGLAAAMDGNRWGFIERSGDWAIAPDFGEAQPFAEIGVAPVRKLSEWMLIGRDGERLDIDLGGQLASLSVGPGEPAPVRTTYAPVYQGPDGKQISLIKDLEIVESFGAPDANLFVVRADGALGIVDSDLNILVPPLFDYIDPPRKAGGLWTAAGGATYQALLKPDGTVVGSEYREVRQISDDLWWASGDDREVFIINRAGKTLAEIDRPGRTSIGQFGPFVTYRAEDETRVFAPQADAPVILEKGFLAERTIQDELLLVKDEKGAVAGLISRDGHYLSRKDHDWVGQIDSVEMRGGWYWPNDIDGRLNILGPDLEPLLTPEAVEKLDGFGVEIVPRVDKAEGPVPIAILDQTWCQCNDEGTGLLLSDGSMVVDKTWGRVSLLEDEPLKTNKPRFAIATAEGIGMIDETGKVLLEPSQDHISHFHNGFALTSQNGDIRALDRNGKLHDIPSGFGLKIVSPGLVTYQETAAADELLRLYDIAAGEPVGEARFRTVQDFVAGQAIAKTADGRLGVIDESGAWILKPDYAEIERINGKLWAVREEPTGEAFSTKPKAIVNAAGETVVAFTPSLKVTTWADGRVEVLSHETGLHRLLSENGDVEIDGRETEFGRVGHWLRTVRRPATGYLTANGDWALPLRRGVGSSFHGDRALFATAEGAHLIDRDGETKADLPAAQWAWPAGADWLVGWNEDEDKTIYADAQGKETLSVAGRSGSFRNGVALHRPDRGEKPGWMDRSGKSLAIGRYRDLSRPDDEGLAYAAAQEGLYGYIDSEGRYLIPPVFRDASRFSDDRAIVMTSSSAMMIDREAHPLARVTEMCGVRVLYGPDNRRVWPESLPERCR